MAGDKIHFCIIHIRDTTLKIVLLFTYPEYFGIACKTFQTHKILYQVTFTLNIKLRIPRKIFVLTKRNQI